MKKITLVLVMLTATLWSLNAFSAGEVVISVELFPVGSFEIKSTVIKGGKLRKKGDKFIVKNIYVPNSSLKTGIELRDEHTQKRLGKNDVIVERAVGRDGEGRGDIVINAVKKRFKFTYEDKEGTIEAKFQLSLEEFNISEINYLGVGVEDEINVRVNLPYIVSKKKTSFKAIDEFAMKGRTSWSHW